MSSFSWKDSSTNAVVPRISYPIKNNDINNLVVPSCKKPGPIKHYRRQLFPIKTSKSNKTNFLAGRFLNISFWFFNRAHYRFRPTFTPAPILLFWLRNK